MVRLSNHSEEQPIKSMWFVYILKCVDNSYYTGITNDIKKRLANHSSKNGSKYVASRLPFELVYKEEYETKSGAAKREAQIKGWSHDKKETEVIQMAEEIKEPVEA